MNWKLYIGYFISFLITAYFVNVPLGNLLELTIPYLLFDGHSFFFNKGFVDVRVAKKITAEIFFVLDPYLTSTDSRRYCPNFVPSWKNNILDLFRWTHFRTCLTDPELIKAFDQIFRARFAGLFASKGIAIYDSSDWTIDQLYSYQGKGFVTADEILAVYSKFNPLNKSWNELFSQRLFMDAFIHFYDFRESVAFGFFSFI